MVRPGGLANRWLGPEACKEVGDELKLQERVFGVHGKGEKGWLVTHGR